MKPDDQAAFEYWWGRVDTKLTKVPMRTASYIWQACCAHLDAHPAVAVNEPMASVLAEVAKATAKFPTWPSDPFHAVAVLGEEFGELTKAVLQHVYEPHKSTVDDVRVEATQTAAMAIRFLMSLDAYKYTRGEQHSQTAIAQPAVAVNEQMLESLLAYKNAFEFQEKWDHLESKQDDIVYNFEHAHEKMKAAIAAAEAQRKGGV